MAEKDLKEIDLERLDQEIEKAIDRIFVEKEMVKEGGEKPPVVSSVEAKAREIPSVPGETDFQKKLEEIEAQLLTIEWEMNPVNIRKGMELTAQLMSHPLCADEMADALDLLHKTLHEFNENEGTVTPASIKFLQDLWGFIKRSAEGKGDERGTVAELRKTFYEIFGIEEALAEEEKEEKVVEAPEKWERFEELMVEHIRRLQRLRKLVDEEIREIRRDWRRVLSEWKRAETKEVTLLKIGEEFYAIPSSQLLRSLSVERKVADAFLRSGEVKLRDASVPLLYIKGEEGEELFPSGFEPVLVFLKIEDEIRGLIVDEVLPRTEMEFFPLLRPAEFIAGWGEWEGKEVKLFELKGDKI